jgi:serine protease Do
LTQGKIAYPFIGVRYIIISDDYAKEEDLSVDYGAIVVESQDGEPSIISNSPADKAGIKVGDIILELDGKKINTDDTLTKIIQNYFPGDQVTLKILRDGVENLINITLGDWSDF